MKFSARKAIIVLIDESNDKSEEGLIARGKF
jgi:hypothetical protein